MGLKEEIGWKCTNGSRHLQHLPLAWAASALTTRVSTEWPAGGKKCEDGVRSQCRKGRAAARRVSAKDVFRNFCVSSEAALHGNSKNSKISARGAQEKVYKNLNDLLFCCLSADDLNCVGDESFCGLGRAAMEREVAARPLDRTRVVRKS